METEQGVCVRCNLPISKVEKIYRTEQGEMDHICFNYKGKMYPHVCKRCNREWFCPNEKCSDDGWHEFCPICMVQGFGKLMEKEGHSDD